MLTEKNPVDINSKHAARPTRQQPWQQVVAEQRGAKRQRASGSSCRERGYGAPVRRDNALPVVGGYHAPGDPRD